MAFTQELGNLSSFGHMNAVVQKADEVVAKFRAVCRHAAVLGNTSVQWTSYDYYSICGRNCSDRAILEEVDSKHLQEPLKELIRRRLQSDAFETLSVTEVHARQGKLPWQLSIHATWRAGLHWGPAGGDLPANGRGGGNPGSGEIVPQGSRPGTYTSGGGNPGSGEIMLHGLRAGTALGGRSNGGFSSMRKARLALFDERHPSDETQLYLCDDPRKPKRAKCDVEDETQLYLCDDPRNAKRAKRAVENARVESSSPQAASSSHSSDWRAVTHLVEMGFEESRAREQLAKSGNDVTQALELLLK